ncbi:hypothetical protein BDL97_03G007500 [Sphagnum fallax]|nr:hypothetical protein BDL97_03G007500 [Sphagnum fallax]
MADWLQFGAAACKRYELLNRPPLLPHEELLCKEAMNVAEMRSCADNCVQKLASEQQHAVKVAFVRLMRSQHQVCWLLKKRGSQTIFTSPGFNTSVTCALCKHMSYVAFVTCRCTVEGPICLNHAQEIRNCTCGISRSVVMREGLLEMEAAAQRFEREEGILEDALKEPSIKYGTHMNELGFEELMFDSEDYSGYKPYGDLMIERAERHAISSDVSSADVKGANIPKYIPGRLKTLVNSQDNSGLATTMNAAHSISIVPQANTEDATGPSWSDDGKEVVQMQSFESAQSQAGGPILEQTNSNKVLEGRDTESFLLLKTLQGDADNNCQCSAEKMVCFCERKHIPTVIPGAKRKRSGLVTRTMPVVKVQISQSKESLSKVLSSTVAASQCASIKVENDNSHHVKRQRMASLEKIRFEHGTSVASPKPQEKTLLARVVNDSGKDPSGEKKVGRKKGCPRVLQTPKGGVLLLQDIIRELNIKAALNEVLSDWQFKAQRKGLDLQFLFVQCLGIGGPQKEGRKLPALTLKGCQQVKSMLTSKKGGRLEKLIEGTFGSATEEVEPKQSSKMSCIESEEFSVQKKQKLINCPEKGGSDFPEQHGAHEISEEVDESLRRRPIVYKAVPVNLSTHIFRQPPAVTQVPKVPAPSQPVGDGKFQDVTVLACERLPYHLSLKSAASQHCRQQSQWSTCISELRPADSDNAHRNKVLSVRKSSSAKENGQLLSKRLESNINSVCNAMHFNVMDTMSNSGVAHEVQTIPLGDKNCSKMLLSSKISVAKSVITQLDGQGSKPELCLPEVGFSAESSVKVHNGHAVKKKLLKKHKKEGSVSAQAVQLAPGHTVSCQRRGDLSRGPDLEHVKKCCRQSGLPLVRIKVKGPQMQEPDSNKLTSDQKIMKDSAQNLILANAPTSSLTSSAVDEGFNRNSNVLEEQCLRKDSAQVAIKDPGRPKSHPSAILQHSEIEAGKRFLGEVEQQKTSILDTDLPSDDRHTLPPKEAGEGGEQCEKVPGLSTDVEKVGDQMKHSPFVPAFSLKDVEVCDNDREGGCAREAHVSPDQALREAWSYAGKFFIRVCKMY